MKFQKDLNPKAIERQRNDQSSERKLPDEENGDYFGLQKIEEIREKEDHRKR